MKEAGIFTGFEDRPSDGVHAKAYGGPVNALRPMYDFLNSLMAILSQVYLMYRTLSGGSTGSGNLGWSSLFLITLSISPTLIGTISSLLRAEPDHKTRRQADRRAREAEGELKAMGRKSEYKQEATLFGLKD